MKTRLGVTVSLLSLSQNSFFPRTSTREEATTLAKVRTSFVSSSLLYISLSLERQARFKIEREREKEARRAEGSHHDSAAAFFLFDRRSQKSTPGCCAPCVRFSSILWAEAISDGVIHEAEGS